MVSDACLFVFQQAVGLSKAVHRIILLITKLCNSNASALGMLILGHNWAELHGSYFVPSLLYLPYTLVILKCSKKG